MALFQNRPLALASVGLIVATLLSFFLDQYCLIALFIGAGLLLLFLICCSFWRKMTPRRFSLILLTVAVLLGCARTATDRMIANLEWEVHMDAEITAELSVREIRYQSTYSTELLVDVLTVEGKRVNTGAVLRSESLLPFYVGDRISGRFTVKPTDYDNYDDGAAYTYLAEGARVILLSGEELSLVESGTNSPSARIADFRAFLAYRITNSVGGEEGNLLAAVLLGTRTALSDRTVRDFSRVGISHVLALSGLHLTILVGLFDRFLLFLRAGKRTRIGIVLPVCLAYLVLTGCQISMIRAVVMLGFVYLAFLWHGDHDAMTALFFCAAVTLFLSPCVIFDTSFQMTMLATLGLLSFGGVQSAISNILPRRKDMLGLLTRFARWVLSSLLVTLSASVLVLPVTWLTFGEIAYIAPLSNLLVLPFAPFMMLGALLAVWIPTSWTGALAALPAKAVLFIVEHLAELDGVISLRYAFVPYVLIPVLLLTAVLLVVDLKRWRALALAPTFVGILAFVICLSVFRSVADGEAKLLYSRDGIHEGLVLMQAENAVLVQTGDCSLTRLKKDWRTVEENGATQLQTLMLTHYHEALPRTLTLFCRQVMVREVLLPRAESEEDKALLAKIQSAMSSLGISVDTYTHGIARSFFEKGRIAVTPPLYEERSVRPAFSVGVGFGSQTVCYHTAALSEYTRHANTTHVCFADRVLIGAYGPVVHEEITLSPTPNEVFLCGARVEGAFARQPGITYTSCPETYVFCLE